MFLSDTAIRERLIDGANKTEKEIIALLEKGHIVLNPFPSPEELAKRLGPCSLDIQLGNKIREPLNVRNTIQHHHGAKSVVHQVVDFRREESLDQPETTYGYYELDENSEFVIEPQTMVRAVTKEFIGLPRDIVGFLHSRSKIGRYGISSSYDAPKFDPGFVGQMVLEISNMGLRPFSLHPGLLICQMLFAQLDQPTSNPYYARSSSSWRWQTEP